MIDNIYRIVNSLCTDSTCCARIAHKKHCNPGRSLYNCGQEVMMDCSTCQHYNRGRGQKACLKCKQYKEIQIKSGRRQSIRTEILPQEIMDNLPDPKSVTLIGIIQHLPIQYSVPLLMRSLLGMTLQQIADYHGVTKQTTDKKISQGIKLIEKSLLDG